MIKDYVKIQTETQLLTMPNMYKASWDVRTDETTRDFCANHDNWLIRKDTECPTYNPDTQYATYKYIEEDGFAKQVWEIHDIEQE